MIGCMHVHAQKLLTCTCFSRHIHKHAHTHKKIHTCTHFSRHNFVKMRMSPNFAAHAPITWSRGKPSAAACSFCMCACVYIYVYMYTRYDVCICMYIRTQLSLFKSNSVKWPCYQTSAPTTTQAQIPTEAHACIAGAR